MKKLSLPALVACAMLAQAGLAPASTAKIAPAKDNTLYEDAAGALSNGAGSYLFVGRTGAGTLRRGLVAFDVAGAVPAGATILSVSLTMNMSRTSSGAEPVALYRLLADWGEGASDAPGAEGGGAASEPGDATWLHTFYDGVFWAAPGGDMAPAAAATISIDAEGTYTWASTPEMVADVQSWLDSQATNFGWALVSSEASTAGAKRFDSRDNAEPSNRPVLTIEYVPEPATLALLAVAAVALPRRRRGR